MGTRTWFCKAPFFQDREPSYRARSARFCAFSTTLLLTTRVCRRSPRRSPWSRLGTQEAFPYSQSKLENDGGERGDVAWCAFLLLQPVPGPWVRSHTGALGPSNAVRWRPCSSCPRSTFSGLASTHPRAGPSLGQVRPDSVAADSCRRPGEALPFRPCSGRGLGVYGGFDF